jgi:DNA invertase Pin-like site-specific DNA recombinase
VLVGKFDRFARSVAYLLKALEECHHLGMRCSSVSDHVDTERPMGQAMCTVIGVMAA